VKFSMPMCTDAASSRVCQAVVSSSSTRDSVSGRGSTRCLQGAGAVAVHSPTWPTTGSGQVRGLAETTARSASSSLTQP
jgi:hypothetical protein